MDPIEIAWAAGFFDGEGSISLHNGGRIWVQVKQNAAPDGGLPDVLARFAAAVGTGRIGGPYSDRPGRRGFSEHRRPYYLWYALLDDAIRVVEVLWPQLGAAKRDDFVRLDRTA